MYAWLVVTPEIDFILQRRVHDFFSGWSLVDPTGGGHVLQDMIETRKKPMKVACQTRISGVTTSQAYLQKNLTARSSNIKRRQLSYCVFGSLRVDMCCHRHAFRFRPKIVSIARLTVTVKYRFDVTREADAEGPSKDPRGAAQRDPTQDTDTHTRYSHLTYLVSYMVSYRPRSPLCYKCQHSMAPCSSGLEKTGRSPRPPSTSHPSSSSPTLWS